MTSFGPWVDGQSTRGLQLLDPTDEIRSPNGRFYLVMQLCCNLALYDALNGEQLWATDTVGQAETCYSVNTLDGELQVSNVATEEALLTSAPFCTANDGDCWTNMILRLQIDGNAVLSVFDSKYRLWSSNTVQCDEEC